MAQTTLYREPLFRVLWQFGPFILLLHTKRQCPVVLPFTGIPLKFILTKCSSTAVGL